MLNDYDLGRDLRRKFRESKKEEEARVKISQEKGLGSVVLLPEKDQDRVQSRDVIFNNTVPRLNAEGNRAKQRLSIKSSSIFDTKSTPTITSTSTTTTTSSSSPTTPILPNDKKRKDEEREFKLKAAEKRLKMDPKILLKKSTTTASSSTFGEEKEKKPTIGVQVSVKAKV
eukprot:TRINITY_DN807_c0_g1_i2.p1 TRINITY_DN807_c0_g1~~TRINITY_DN807_c0_g1_i2.p1  ORF type:complete len:171 (+),score=58.89 TRINITY_DN807_c0_g1_i2:397-909(+)